MRNRESADQDLHCAACGDVFVFTAGEQELFRLRGITAQPAHCPSCARGGGALANPHQGTPDISRR